ncbi:hypothetical protein [Mucilaginibacter ginkgonis]|uniref:Uncharacterized protein n=1 Tax=Mucilaginibacter ginkgonis TaxID=2682091 RepID=A0A6I4HU99_9SPHI|nr:hypothetical protein [Mucilaginibacter ginkgonis]QQL50337.1 hypothetical protein GO620_002460 [Mucilaginibacter ginkgonis]
MIKGQTTLSAFTKALKDNQIVTNALIQSQLNGKKAAQTEITSITAVYNATQNLTLSRKRNLEAADLLRKQFPDSFKGMSNEAIVAGKAAEAYKNLKKQLEAVSEAQEHKKNITTNVNRASDNDQKIIEETKNLAKLQAEKKTMDDLFNTYASIPFGEESALSESQKIDAQIEKIKKSQKIIADLKSDTILLNKQNSLLGKDINEKFKNFGTVILSAGKDLHQGQVKSSFTGKNELSKADGERQVQQESIQRMALLQLDGYAKEVEAAKQHFDNLKNQHSGNSKTLDQIEKERIATFKSIHAKFAKEDLDKLTTYQQQLESISTEGVKTAKAQAFKQLDDERVQKLKIISDTESAATKVIFDAENLKKENEGKLSQKELDDLNAQSAKALQIKTEAADKKLAVDKKYLQDKAALQNTFDLKDKKDFLEGEIINDDSKTNKKAPDFDKELNDKKALLKLEYDQDIEAAKLRGDSTYKIEQEYKQKALKLQQDHTNSIKDLNKKKQEDEVTTQRKYVQALGSVAGAVTAIFGKNTVAARAAFKAHQAAAAAQVIIDTKSAIMGIWAASAGIPIIGTAKAIAETVVVAAAGASNLAAIIKQKPGFAQGGQYISDGRGAILPGYSRTDNTNAYLRSGEAVVVSEAMRNPWARNLVSAINVAHGGRDFSIPNPGRGYAIGGIFTDGGNANRYYNQPIQDHRDLANTLAYQMINNFPPIYVDVKDVNNQQNILAQTVNRVNL